MSSAKWRPFCIDFNVLVQKPYQCRSVYIFGTCQSSLNGPKQYIISVLSSSIDGMFLLTKLPGINSIAFAIACWRHGTWSALIQVMACCLMAPIHYMIHCWPIVNMNSALAQDDGLLPNDQSIAWAISDFSLKRFLHSFHGNFRRNSLK